MHKKYGKAAITTAWRTGVAGCVILAALTGAGCSRFQSTETLLGNAQAALQKGDRAEAIIHLKNALQKEPQRADARLLLGQIYVEIGDGLSAEKELRKALELGVSPIAVWPSLAKALLLSQNYKAVLEQVPSEGEYKPPVLADLLSVRATALLMQSKIAEAQKMYEQALQLNPESDAALFGLARTAAARSEFGPAYEMAGKLLAKTPKNSDVLLFRSDLERLQGKIDEARASAQLAVDSEPRSVRARAALGNLALMKNDVESASKQADEIKKLAPGSPGGFYLRALIESQKKNHTVALEEVQKALKASPNHLPSLLLAAMIEYSLGSYNQAERHVQSVLAATSQNVPAKKLLAAVYLRTQRASAAIELLGSIGEQVDKNGDIASLLGEAHLQLGEYQKAAQYFASASRENPEDAKSLEGLAMSKLATGDMDEGIRQLEAAVKLDPARSEADAMLIASRIQRGEYEKALATIEQLEKKTGANARSYVLRAQVASAQKKFDEARKFLEQAQKMDEKDFQPVHALARLDIQDNKLEDGRQRLEAFVKKNDRHSEALIALAEWKARSNAPRQEVIDALKKAASLDARVSRPLEILARYYVSQGMTEEALETAQKAQTLAPDLPAVLHTLGMVQMIAGDANQASSTYTKLARLQPRSPQVFLRLAQALHATGNRNGALANVRRAVELDPKGLETLEMAVALHLNNQQVAEALNFARQAQKIHPNSPAGFLLEGDVLMAQKQPMDAIARYDQALKLAPVSAVLLRKLKALDAAGKSREAEQVLAGALTRFPQDVALKLFAGDRAIANNQSKQALGYFESALQVDPNNYSALNNLAWAQHQMKDPQAEQTIEKALKLKPDHPALLDTQAMILKQSGKSERAVQILQKAVGLAPDNGLIRFHYAQALLETGQKESARRELETLKKMGERFPQQAEVDAYLTKL